MSGASAWPAPTLDARGIAPWRRPCTPWGEGAHRVTRWNETCFDRPFVVNAASAPLSVLVVDDDPAAREAVAAAVSFLGYGCRSATDGLDAWDIHRHAPADIILSDWNMPRMDGIELLRRIRAEDCGSYTYFMLMTSFSDKQHFVRGMEAGLVRALGKEGEGENDSDHVVIPWWRFDRATGLRTPAAWLRSS